MTHTGFEIKFDSKKHQKIFDTVFKPKQNKTQKKVLLCARQAAIYLRREVQKKIRRSSNKNQVETRENKLYYYQRDGKLAQITRSPTEWMTGKRSVASGGGRGGRTRVIPEDQSIFRWNKVSKPGTSPISHPANQPGWQDEWLRNSILFDENHGHIVVFSNPAPPGKRKSKSGALGRMYPKTLEEGGIFDWRRKIPMGYIVMTLQQGFTTNQGDGVTLQNGPKAKMQNDGKKIYRHELKSKGGIRGRYVNAHMACNKSGKTRKSHYRKFKEPHVALRRAFKTIGQSGVQMEARPFMAPTLQKFMKDYFPQLFSEMIREIVKD